MSEIWKDVPGYGGHYEASSIGRIKSKARIVVRGNRECHYHERILSPVNRDKYGHKAVSIGWDGNRKLENVHTMVLKAFVGECPKGMVACHNDGNAANNCVENLRWDTQAANNGDRKAHGRYANGEDHPMNMYRKETILSLRSGKLRREDTGMSKSHYWRVMRGMSWKCL